MNYTMVLIYINPPHASRESINVADYCIWRITKIAYDEPKFVHRVRLIETLVEYIENSL